MLASSFDLADLGANNMKFSLSGGYPDSESNDFYFLSTNFGNHGSWSWLNFEQLFNMGFKAQLNDPNGDIAAYMKELYYTDTQNTLAMMNMDMQMMGGGAGPSGGGATPPAARGLRSGRRELP